MTFPNDAAVSCVIIGSMNIHISVRSFVEFIMRSGDIDDRTDYGADPEAMQAGCRMHRLIQKSMPDEYRAEVPLKMDFQEDGIVLTLEGRADGIMDADGKTMVDEIKCVYSDLKGIQKPQPVHLAQAKCYAAAYADLNGIRNITCQITYCSLETEGHPQDIKRFRFDYTAEELKIWLQDAVGRYFKWARFESSHDAERNSSAAALAFPFAYREGQKKTATDVYRAILRSRNLFIQAPTGVGKTLSVVFPSVKAVGEGLSSRIFYLTAKTVTRTVAEETFALLKQSGLCFKTVTITAKEKACLNNVFACNPDDCPYAKGHFDRINEAVYDIINSEDIITSREINEYANKHKVCPYEYSLDISNWCDAVIGDYNYAFDPRVRLRRYFSDVTGGDYLLLIDEAHNLVSRASEMFSASLKKEDVLKCRKLIRKNAPGRKRLLKSLTALNSAMLSLKKETAEDRITVLNGISSYAEQLDTLYTELSRFLETKKHFDDRKEVLDFFFEVRTFIDVCARTGKGYRIYAKNDDADGFFIRLLCIDPAANLSESLALCRSAVFFSATLLPVNYYKELLTGNRDEYAVYAPSPFDPEKRLLVVGSDVTSRYDRRNEKEYEKIASYIIRTVSVRSGNYICFFPSYAYLKKVEPYLCGRDYRIITQSQNMPENEREKFLREFDQPAGGVLLGLCVMGGVFAEGIDLAHEKLIGVFVVGTGLPMINDESELTKEYFAEDGKPGFDYAYRFPGMNKVMQAAGRVIRTDTDCGIIELLDDRFLQPSYRALFPQEWENFEITDINGIAGLTESFWKQREKEKVKNN